MAAALSLIVLAALVVINSNPDARYARQHQVSKGRELT